MKDQTVLNVEGMTCASCAMSISRLLEKKGLKDVLVNFATGEVTFVNGEIHLNEIVSGINSLGYHVVEKEKAAHRNE